jgi:tRNA threonylcarbamoyladenosine biosynthesis protein TsaB
MKNLLAIETSSACCSVALITEHGKLFTRETVGERVHHEFLLPMINQVLEESGLKGSDLQGVLLSVGPGSFTGVRIGTSVAQGFAFAHGLQILPLSSLWVLAQVAVTQLKEKMISFPCRLAVAVDARMQAAYCHEYEVQKKGDAVVAIPLGVDQLLPVSDFLNQISPAAYLVGSAITAEAALKIETLPKAWAMPALLDLALERGIEWVEPEAAQPVYIDGANLYQT